MLIEFIGVDQERILADNADVIQAIRDEFKDSSVKVYISPRTDRLEWELHVSDIKGHWTYDIMQKKPLGPILCIHRNNDD